MARSKKVTETAIESVVDETPTINKEETLPKEPKKPSYSGDSIIEALKSVNIDSSYASRQNIWKANNLKDVQGMDYLGLGQQNLIMLKLFKDGKLAL